MVEVHGIGQTANQNKVLIVHGLSQGIVLQRLRAVKDSMGWRMYGPPSTIPSYLSQTDPSDVGAGLDCRITTSASTSLYSV